jgi:DNA repair protein RadC
MSSLLASVGPASAMLAGQKGGNMKDNWKKYEVQIVRTGDDGDRTRIVTPQDLANLFNDYAESATKEALFVVSFDGQNGVIGINKVYDGTATGTSVRIAEVLQPSLLMNAAGFAVVHNHPSGNADASEEDLKLTQELLKAASVMDLVMLDHIVIGGNNKHTSIRRDNQEFDWNS